MSRMANAVAVVHGERESMRVASSWTLLAGSSISSKATEEAGDSLERLTDTEDMKAEWGILTMLLVS